MTKPEGKRVHRLLMERRGRKDTLFLASCSCGWIGVTRRHRKDAMDQHRAHVASATRVSSAAPRDVTPVADLPDVLR